MSTVLSDDEARRNVGANLSRLMGERELSTYKVAEAIGSSHTIINQYARGLKLPGSGALARLAEFFGVSTDWFLEPHGKRRKTTA